MALSVTFFQVVSAFLNTYKLTVVDLGHNTENQLGGEKDQSSRLSHNGGLGLLSSTSTMPQLPVL